MSVWPFDAATLARTALTLPRHPEEGALGPAGAERLGIELAHELATGSWSPRPARLFPLARSNGKVRWVGKLVRRDRVVQRALLTALDGHGVPLPGVTAYVRGRGAWQTIHWLEGQLQHAPTVWSMDVVDFFPSIDHALLWHEVERVVGPAPWRAVLRHCVAWPVVQGGRISVPERGILQGGVLSGWLSNLALTAVDGLLGETAHRYCDNLFLAGTEAQVRRQGVSLVAALGRLGLRVRIAPPEPGSARVGIDCLGHRVSAQGRAPGRRRMASFLQRLERRLRGGDATGAADLARGHRAFYRDQTWRGVMEIDELLRAGRLAEALERLRAEQVRLAALDETLELSAEETDLLLAAVGGDPDRHGRWTAGDPAGRSVVSRGLRADDLARHRRGEVSLGVLPVDGRGRAHVGVIDLDGDPGVDTTHEALRVADQLRAEGRSTLVERTGGRGHHVWVPISTPEPFDQAANRLVRSLQAVGPAPSGIRREVFPSPPDRDPAVRLPLGRHPVTGRPSQLLGPTGQPLRPGELAERLDQSTWPDLRWAGPRRILEACGLLAELAREACTTHDLGHDGRYSLASVLATVAGGSETVHAIIAHCTDYDHGITQGFLDRLHPRPLGCKRLKERHPHLADRCACPRATAELPYPSPVRFANPRPSSGPRRAAPDRAADADELERLAAGVRRSLLRLRGE